MIMYVVLAICLCSSLLIKYSTFTVFMSSVKKALIEHVSVSIISIIDVGFRKIIAIIIVSNNVNGLQIYSWETPVFIGKMSKFTSSSLTDCLRLV